MRHGEPEIPPLPEKITSREFRQCLALYNQCGILRTSNPGDHVVQRYQDCRAIVCSDFKRSIESASRFVHYDSLIIDPLFREIEDSFIPIPFIKLAPPTWGRVYILLWLVGAFEIKRGFLQGKVRAKACADKLVSLAEEHGQVLYVGHGFINTYIAKELRALGWSGPKLPSKHYWDYGEYHYSG